MWRAATPGDDFAAAFARHHGEAVRLAWLLTSDAHDAEEVTAEAFAKVYRRWRQGGIDDLAAYLRRAVVNEANSRLRRRYRDRDRARRRTGEDRGVVLHDDHGADRDEVFAALRRLPPRQRAAVVLRFYDDLPLAEVATAMDVDVGTARSHVSRGLARLAELLGDDHGPRTHDITPAPGRAIATAGNDEGGAR